MENHERKTIRIVNPRAATLLILIVIPVLIYIVVGTIALWQTGYLIWLWWIVPAFWLVTWLVAWVWKPQSNSENRIAADHWTPRDQSAAEIVHAYQEKVQQLSVKELSNPHFYLDQAQSLAHDLAGHYHPHADDPYSSLTIPEIAAAVRLVADDLEHLTLHSLPGSRMLTIKQWKSLQHAPKWLKRIRTSAWAAAMFLNPLNIARFGAAKATIEPATSSVQTEILATIYLRLIRQVGFYLIEMNSGRLRGGADVYRETFGQDQKNASALSEPTGDSEQIENLMEDVAISVVGQVSSGKSSLINRILGENRATVDLLPATESVERYQAQIQGQNHDDTVTVSLLDTPGYGESGVSPSQLEQIQLALRESDLVLLVVDAHSPAREADRVTLQQISEWYSANPNLRPPSILGVLTHVDLLSPAMSWAPPYDVSDPTSQKGKSIAEALEYNSSALEKLVVGFVPVCAEKNRQWGIGEYLMPELVKLLTDAKSVALLNAFERKLDSESPLNILLKQAKQSGKQLVTAWLQEKNRRMNSK